MGDEVNTRCGLKPKYEEFKGSSLLFPNHTKYWYFVGEYFNIVKVVLGNFNTHYLAYVYQF